MEKLNNKIDKAIKEQYKNSYEYHKRGEEEIRAGTKDYRAIEMAERLMVG